jgi:hypothetical protein
MLDTAIIPENTTITAKGDGAPIDLTSATKRVFLLLLNIKAMLEQQSVEISILGSSDGQTWSAKPILTIPQKFYRGETPVLLDLSAQPDVKFVRAHWEVNRWGRGPSDVMFELGLSLREVPAEMLVQK